MPKQDLTIPGEVGGLQAVLQLPDTDDFAALAIVCHPHPQQGGTMDNKVVTTVAKAYNMMGIASLRFNYRGVGTSEGSYGAITGEVADGLAVVRWVQQQYPNVILHFAGFSFGTYVAAYAASKSPAQSLITIAPPVERMPFTTLSTITCPWLVIQPEADEVVVPAAVYAWYDQLVADKDLIKVPAAGHFFHGQLNELRDIIVSSYSNE